jgi:hypothetical protein
MGTPYNTHGRDDEFIQGFGNRNWRKEPLGSLRDRFEDNIKKDLREIIRDVDWIHSADNGDKWRGFAKKTRHI